MLERVIPNYVASLCHIARDSRPVRHKASDQQKRGADIVPCEKHRHVLGLVHDARGARKCEIQEIPSWELIPRHDSFYRMWAGTELLPRVALLNCQIAVNSFRNCVQASGKICCKRFLIFSEACSYKPWPIFLNCPGILQWKVPYASAKARWRESWRSA